MAVTVGRQVIAVLNDGVVRNVAKIAQLIDKPYNSVWMACRRAADKKLLYRSGPNYCVSRIAGAGKKGGR